MAQTLNAPLNVQLQNGTQLTQQIQNSINAVGFNFGGAKGLRSLSQPLGRLTGQADEFTKSLDAANARVLAFGASVGVVNAVSNAFKALVNSTIEVEKAITEISVVGEKFTGQTKELTRGLFEVSKLTGQSFAEVSKAALEFARQGQGVEETLQRTKDALILTRTTGLDAAKSVDGLTAAVNAFAKAGLSTTQVLNKLAAVDQAFAVSSADLIEAFQRTGAVAQQAGVSFDELAGIVTALQTETSRGGAVIGNALKTIFSRLQDTSTLTQLQNLGVAVQDLQGNVLPARQILQNLAGDLQGLSKITQAGVFKDVAGTFQLNQLVSLVNDLNKAQSISAAATQKSAGATNEAFVANEKLNQSLDAILNKVATTGKQLGSLLGEIGLSDNLKGILDGLNSFLESANNVLQGDDLGSKFAKGFVKGIGAVLSGPGLGVFLAIIVKLSYDLLKFGAQSLKTFFNIGKAANDQKQVQESIVQTLLKNQNVLNNILSAQGGQNAQGLKFLGILNQQAAAMQAIQSLAGNIAGTVYSAGYRQTPQGLARRSAGGYLPAQEAADVRRGVGGASPNSKVVAIPNFAFGGGKRGTMIANTSEYIVPNYAGGGSAIFNQDMVKTMGLPAGAKKIGASGGFVPNFANEARQKQIRDVSDKYALITNDIQDGPVKIRANPKNDLSVSYELFSYGIPSLTKLKNNANFKDSRFTNEALIEKYKKLALDEASDYSLAIGGRTLGPYEREKLSNPGVVAGLVGAIFESGIAGVINGDGLRKAQSEQASNARFDFVNQPDVKKFFGIQNPNIKYIEAKYSKTSDALKSLGNKILNIESSSTLGMAREKFLSGKPLVIRQGNFFEQLQKVKGKNFQAKGLTMEQIASLKEAGGTLTSSSAIGYIPNFAASALQQAIAREKSAGLSDSQIYVDQNPSLKSPQNPMGLMVANTRDEPFGGVQGISRARKEGVNPKTYGAANGFVPNYAQQQTGGANSNIEKVEKGFGDLAGKFIVLQSALSFFQGGFTEAGSVAEKFSTGLQTAVSAVFAYQAIQSIGTKKTIVEMMQNNQALSKFRKDLYQAGQDIKKGGGARAALVARGGKLPSTASKFEVLGASYGTGRIGDLRRSVTGGIRQDAAASFLSARSVAGAAGASLIALKSFNDIASLLYTKNPKVASSLELLSSAANAATSSLSDLERSELSGIESFATSKRGTGEAARDFIVRALANIDITALGKEKVGIRQYKGAALTDEALLTAKEQMEQGALSYKDYFKMVEESNKPKSQLKYVDLVGGQTTEDFNSARQKLIELVFTDLKVKNNKSKTKLSSEELNRAVDEKVNSIFVNAINNVGELDLGKIGDITIVKDYISNAKEVSKQLQITASNVEFEKPLQVFKRTIEQVIFEGSQTIENASQDLQRRAKVISAITSSKSFATLGDSSKIAFEINSSLEQFNAEYNNKIQKLLNETQETLKDYLPELGIAQEKQEPIRKAFEAVGKATDQKDLPDALKNVVSQIQSAGVSLDNAKFQELQKKVTSSTNAFSNLIKEQDTELAILQLNNQEKLLEAKAYDTYRKQLGNFVDGVIKSEKSLIALRGAIERIDVSKNQNIEIRSAYAKTTADTILIRMEEEISALNQKRDKEIEASFQEAQIAAQREFFTKENIAELNRNTVAIEKLTSVLSVDLIRDLDSAIVESIRLEAIDSLTSIKGQEKKYSDIAGIPLPEGMTAEQATNYLKDLKNTYSPNPNFIGDGGLQNANQYLSQVTDFVKQGINANQGFGSIQSNISGLGLNQSVTDKLTKYAEDIFNAAQKQSATWEQSLETARATYDSQLKIYEATNSYVAKLGAQRRSLVDSLTDPQTLGEYNTKLRQINRQDYESALPTDQARQTYRSSFGYGFSEAMDAVEQRTLDFRNQLGKEIPDLFSQNLAQGLNDAISGAKTLKEALTDAATSFFQEITRRNISNLADLVTGGLGKTASAGGGFFSNLFKASGGLIKGGSGTKDDVPAMLMGGEYVVKKSAVNKYGKGFLDAINNGNMRGYATGGIVDPQTFPTQTGRGGFFTPGDYGQGAITGKNELLTFATQSFTGGQYDYMGGLGMSGATVSLEPESARLSALGREGSPMFERVQQSKDEAFRVYLEGLQKEKEYADLLDQIAKDKKARKKALQTAIISAVISSAASYAGTAMKVGAANASAAGGSKLAGAFVGSGGQGGLFNILRGTGRSLSTSAQALEYAKTAPLISNLSQQLTKQAFSSKTASPSNSNLSLPKAILANPNFTNLLLPQPRASGGLISGGSNIRDDVPAMLTGGEFVLNNRATQRIGLQNLNKLNSGAPISSEGPSPEMTQALISKLDELIQTTANSSKENVVVNVSTNEAGGQSTENPAGAEKELQKKIREAVLNVIAQEKRLGGSLEKSR